MRHLHHHHKKTFYLYSIFAVFGLLLSLSSCKTPVKTVVSTKPGQKVIAPMDPKTKQLHEIFMEGSRQKLLGNNENAIKQFLACLDLDPKNAACFYELGQLYHEQGQMGDALSMTKKAAEYEPSNTWFQFFLAQLFEQSQQYKQAVEVYKKLTRLQPDSPEFYEALAQNYVYSGQYNEAIKVYDQVENKFGIDESVSLQKQKIFLSQGKLDKAIVEINKLVASNPFETRYLAILAETCMANGMPDKALEAYNKILQLDPNDPYVHISLSDFYRKSGNKEKSFEELKAGFANPNLDVDTKVQILLSFFALSDAMPELKDQTYELIQEVIKVHPKDPKGYSVLGDYYYMVKKPKEALAAYHQVIKIDSSRYAIWEQVIRLESELEDNHSMVTDSKRAMDLFPEQPLPYLFNGMGEYQLKNYENAIKSLKQGVSLVVDNDDIEQTFYSLLGDAYNQVKDNTKSDEAYEKALRLKPDDPYVLNNYSYFLSLRSEKLDKAETMAKRATELSPDNSSNLDTYAWVLYKLGKLTDAEKFILTAIDKGGNNNAVILEHYGDILFKKGEPDKALEFWQKAKDAGKGSDLLDKKLNEKKLYE
ncbi:MAG: tetratricopeptide repeat protein [Bacteroidetes bacterium]|nr:tetratricopeptide repeat protein [Bacteroidota bacterium]